MALELVSGADFWCKLMSRAGPVDLGGVMGSNSGLKPRKTGPKTFSQTAFKYLESESSRPRGNQPLRRAKDFDWMSQGTKINHHPVCPWYVPGMSLTGWHKARLSPTGDMPGGGCYLSL